MPKTNNIPEVRFAGFTDAWEQRKLSELATMHARIGWQNLRTSEFLDSGDYMLITGTDFNDGAINYSTCHFVERERYEQDKHIQIKNGSILITKDGTLGKVAYVQGLSMPATLNAGVFNVEIKDETKVDNKYLFQYLKAPFLMDYVDKKATGGTIKHLNQNILVDFPVLLPSKAEQKAIGVYFERLDNLITLHQRKYERLKNVKKSMLEKMFPKNGSNIPEIRFAGFTDAWEQRKLDTITDVRDGTHDSPQYVETGHPFITSKNVKDGFINYEDIQYVSDKDYEEINKRSKVDKNDILMGMIGTIGNIALVRETPDFAIKNVALIKDIGDVYYRYLYHCLQSNSAAHQLDENLDGGTKKFIALNKIRELVIPVPSEHEQHKIGDYMESLDNLITLHQRKLEKLQNIKKSMLEKMFV